MLIASFLNTDTNKVQLSLFNENDTIFYPIHSSRPQFTIIEKDVKKTKVKTILAGKRFPCTLYQGKKNIYGVFSDHSVEIANL